MTTIKRFTAANLARSLNIDPRVARRRLRSHMAKDSKMPERLSDEQMSRKNGKWEWRDNKTNVAAVTAIIETPADDETSDD